MFPVLGKKAVLEWFLKEGLIGSSYVCPKCGKSFVPSQPHSGLLQPKRVLHVHVQWMTVDDSLFLGTWTDKQSSIPYHDVCDAGLDFVGIHVHVPRHGFILERKLY
ncbi:hypothetical protein TNCV_4303781 [Trichonephila clavipes]|nr:hypothetical protein TNCV_4303781 [Trichonephila clavipes]